MQVLHTRDIYFNGLFMVARWLKVYVRGSMLRESSQTEQMEGEEVWTESVRHGGTYCFAHCFPAVIFV